VGSGPGIMDKSILQGGVPMQGVFLGQERLWGLGLGPSEFEFGIGGERKGWEQRARRTKCEGRAGTVAADCRVSRGLESARVLGVWNYETAIWHSHVRANTADGLSNGPLATSVGLRFVPPIRSSEPWQDSSTKATFDRYCRKESPRSPYHLPVPQGFGAAKRGRSVPSGVSVVSIPSSVHS
jgi:hypothetical protein